MVTAVEKQGGTQLIEYGVADVAIRDLAQKYAGMQIVDTASYQTVVGGIREVRGLRIQVETKRKELKKDALEWGRKVDTEAKRITGMLAPIEDELKEVKGIEDDRKAAIREKKERIERERVRGIREKISRIQRFADGINTMQREHIEDVLADCNAMTIETEEFQEFASEAEEVFTAVREVIQTALKTRIKLDQEAEERRVEAEGLAKVRAEQEVEAKRLAEAEAKRKIEEATLAAERRVIEEEKNRIEAEKKAEVERKEREALEKKLALKAKIQAEKDAKEKAERDELECAAKEDREAAEKIRQEALKPDKEKMADYGSRLAGVEIPELKDSGAKAFTFDATSRLAVIVADLTGWYSGGESCEN